MVLVTSNSRVYLEKVILMNIHYLLKQPIIISAATGQTRPLIAFTIIMLYVTEFDRAHHFTAPKTIT